MNLVFHGLRRGRSVQQKYKILFFARDAGGVNALVPVIKRFRNKNTHQSIVLSHPDSRSILENESVENIPLDYFSSHDDRPIDCDRVVQKLSPDILVTTKSVPLQDMEITIEQQFIKSAKQYRKKSVVVLDSWGDYQSRFCSKEGHLLADYCPTITCALDVESSERLMQIGFSNDEIRITGNPHFDKVIADSKIKRVKPSRDIVKKAINILYVSQPMREKSAYQDYGLDQEELFITLKETVRSMNLEKLKNIIIWKHPKEYLIDWTRLEESHDPKIKCVLSDDRGPCVFTRIDGFFTLFSTMIYEALYYDIPSFNLLIGCKKDLSDFLIAGHLGLSTLVRNKLDLIRALESIHSESAKETMKTKRLKLEESRVFFSDGKATDRVVDVINEMLGAGN